MIKLYKGLETMIKKPFWGFKKLELQYNTEPLSFQDVPVPQEVIIFLKRSDKESKERLFHIGDMVKTGQKLKNTSDSLEYVISPVTGKIVQIFFYTDAFGRSYDGIKIESNGSDNWDAPFDNKPTLETAAEFLECVPGAVSFKELRDVTENIHTIIINGMDVDLGITINQQIVREELSLLKKGIGVLKQMMKVDNIIIVVPETLTKEVHGIGIDVKTLPVVFPHALPSLIIKNIFNKVIPSGKKPENIGITVVNAESVVAIADAFETRKIPVTKALSVIAKDGKVTNIRARIGTLIGDILKVCNIILEENDRVILGGPMLGTTTYSKDLPIEPSTDAITVQSESHSAQVTDFPCINCGECVRICPANIQVNMLGRFAEFGLYEDAKGYDLYSCIECALCAYVCTARRPLLQYIKLAKHELEILEYLEATDEQ
ncbi:MAG: 4Fe-4S dicluster domain-containing protein [Thermodesulfobacteriota bacterium]|nr:4Fe-4S dicluster domain-containing protein [Thermodesulfobacteriota bacterium]